MLDRIISLPDTSSFFLFGPRQTGKSTLIQSRFRNKAIWTVDLLLSDVFLRYAKYPDLFRRETIKKIADDKITTVFVDEIQRVPMLLNEVHYLMQHYDCQFILTGSSARKLKRGGANLLAGRAVQRRLFPFVFLEIESQFDIDDALLFGTLPAIFSKSPLEKKDILTAYVHTYLKEEIKSEGIVRNLGGFSRFLDIAASQFGEVVNFSNIARECHLPVRSVQSYYEILEDTFIGFRLEPWRKSIRRRLSAHPKFYLFDNGVTNALNRHLSEPPDHFTKGRLFEQWIILETIYCLHYRSSEIQPFFWRTNHGAEVDLLLVKHNKIIAAIEIKLTSVVTNAHLTGLRSFREENQDVPCYVVCSTGEPYELEQIRVISWREFIALINRI